MVCNPPAGSGLRLVLLAFLLPLSVTAFTMYRRSLSICRRAIVSRDSQRGARMILPRHQVQHSVQSQLRWKPSFARQIGLFSSAPTSTNTIDPELEELEDFEYTSHDTINAKDDTIHELERLGIRSRPVEGGTWNVKDPLGWARNFGRRSPEQEAYFEAVAHLKPGDEKYIDVSDITVPGVTIVRTREHAKQVVERLIQADPSIFHACDTEVMGIALKEVGPVGNGYVTCVSVYSGPDFDYGDGPGKVLWIDNIDDAYGVLQEFKEWFEDERFLKVWHNYGFDRHVMWNEGIDVQGLGGDTMHMARLQNTSRSKLDSGNGYSLEALTEELLQKKKKPMKEIFGVKRLRKDGSEGSLVDIPPVEEMQRDPQFRVQWIEYSCYDAKSTWEIRETLEHLLKEIHWFDKLSLWDYYWMHMRYFAEVLTDMERRGIRVDARDYLSKVEQQAREDRDHHSRIFRQWAATKIGPAGLALNPASSIQLQTLLFGGAPNAKTKIATDVERTFRVPTEEIAEDALEALMKREEKAEPQTNSESKEKMFDDLNQLKVAQLKTLCKERGLQVTGKKAELQERLRNHFLAAAVAPEPDFSEFEAMPDDDLRDCLKARGISSIGTRKQLLDRLKTDRSYISELVTTIQDNRESYLALGEALEIVANNEGGAIKEYLAEIREKSGESPKHIDVTIRSLGLQPEKYTAGGAPSVTADVIRRLAGDPFADPPKYGTAYEYFGKEGCEALYSLCAIGSIDTMIANFLTSLQELIDDQSRVHCSLNLNTETGRLSSRRPNLQNQPALEKDKYQIRKAFQASPGNNLIVADYGQLELRLLASMTRCKAMIDAFEAGGDFHSRTALDMFDYIRKNVEAGECLLEWDYANGKPPKPLLKDMFASERRKAKTLNFSIAYGKTAHGLSQDWGVSPKEAESMLNAWYNARNEVKKWQDATKAYARKYGVTRTLMGRYRHLPDARGGTRKLVGHAERASINTPIQGGAADVAMMAMNKINSNEKLKKLGWILVLQIHDEVILEGPEETAEEAFGLVKKCMEEPWVLGLEKTAVPLLVDGSYMYKTWYDAK